MLYYRLNYKNKKIMKYADKEEVGVSGGSAPKGKGKFIKNRTGAAIVAGIIIAVLLIVILAL